MNPSAEILYTQSEQMAIPTQLFPLQKTCDIDFPKIKTDITNLQNYAQQFSQKNPILPGNKFNTQLLLDNTFYNLTNKLIDDMTSINIAKLKCMGNNDKNKFCNGYKSSQQSIQQMNDLLIVLNKYTVPLQKLFNWIKTIGSDSITYCDGNTNQTDKVKELINRINVITGNIPPPCPEESTITGTNLGLFTTNFSSCISLCILLIIIIGLLVFKFK